MQFLCCACYKKKLIKKLAWQRPTLAQCTTIGAKVLNCCVRDGNRCVHFAIATRLCLSKLNNTVFSVKLSPRSISNSQLHTSPCFHICPINLIVYKGSYFEMNGESHLKGGFTLRCFQRLSRPHLATQL